MKRPHEIPRICNSGYPITQLEQELDTETFAKLNRWLEGQGEPICTDDECGPHGFAVFESDLKRFFLLMW